MTNKTEIKNKKVSNLSVTLILLLLLTVFGLIIFILGTGLRNFISSYKVSSWQFIVMSILIFFVFIEFYLYRIDYKFKSFMASLAVLMTSSVYSIHENRNMIFFMLIFWGFLFLLLFNYIKTSKELNLLLNENQRKCDYE